MFPASRLVHFTHLDNVNFGEIGKWKRRGRKRREGERGKEHKEEVVYLIL